MSKDYKKWPILLKVNDDDYCIIHQNGQIEFPCIKDRWTSVIDSYVGSYALSEIKLIEERKLKTQRILDGHQNIS